MFCSRLRGVSAVTLTDLFPPFKNMSVFEFDASVSANGCWSFHVAVLSPKYNCIWLQHFLPLQKKQV